MGGLEGIASRVTRLADFAGSQPNSRRPFHPAQSQPPYALKSAVRPVCRLADGHRLDRQRLGRTSDHALLEHLGRKARLAVALQLPYIVQLQATPVEVPEEVGRQARGTACHRRIIRIR